MTETPSLVTETARAAVLEYLRHPTPSALRKLRLIVPEPHVVKLQRIARDGYHADAEISTRYTLPLGHPEQWSYRTARPDDLRPGTRFEYQANGNQVVLIAPCILGEPLWDWRVARISQVTGEATGLDTASGGLLISSVKFALIVEGLPLVWDPHVDAASRDEAERCIAGAADKKPPPALAEGAVRDRSSVHDLKSHG